MFIRQLQIFFFAAALTAAVAAAQTSMQTTTSGTITSTTTTPPVGVASSETVQVNLVNTASNATNGTAAACAGTITFLNASGTAIVPAATFNVSSGVIASFSLPFGKMGATGNRTEVRVSVARTITVTGAPMPPCSLDATLETFDTSTGVTHVYVPNVSIAGAVSGRPVIMPGH